MINKQFLDTINEYKMLQPKDRVLVAVSGGADSTALLNLLYAHRDELKITLHVAHLNHLIRKSDAELDVRYVQQLAQKLDIPVAVESFDVQAYAKEGRLGLEVAARQIRYAFFDKVAKQIGANRIAIAHSADDNVETFLMRLLRGAGLDGLCGIPPRRGIIIRPLIKIWRRQIEDYMATLKLVSRRDYTNFESRYQRNQVRLKLIPQLKLYNLNIKEIILQTILLLTEDRGYLETKAEEALFETIKSFSDDEIVLRVDKLQSWEYPIQGHLLRKAIEKVKGNLSELTFKHVRSILDNLEKDERWEMHLPGEIYVVARQKELLISREKPTPLKRIAYRYTLAVPGVVEIREIGKRIRTDILDSVQISDSPNVACIDFNVLGKNVVARSRQDGDKFSPLGMRGSKKLQDFFVDEKIPVQFRDSMPVIESDGVIVWVGGLRIDERARVTKRTKKIVRLELL